MQGKIVRIERRVASMGPGFRTAFTLSGCSRHCPLCRTPEAQGAGGRSLTPEEAAYLLIPDDPYLRRGGGVTLTGGILEDLAYTRSLASVFRARDYHVALLTPGFYPEGAEAQVIALLAETDLLIAELPFLTEADCLRYAGGSLTEALAFLAFADDAGCEIWARHTVIPGMSDTPAAAARLKRLLSPFAGLSKIELFPFRASSVRPDSPFAGLPDCPEETAETLQAYLY
ncbi:MAG: radical SAM protein [Clostridia bacterium]|nr:radical SAM protein [Clostridia bacterium]